MSHFAPKKQTFNAMRSALKRRALSRVTHILRAQDALQKLGDLSVQWQRSVLQLQSALKEAEVINDLNRQTLLDMTERQSVQSFSKRKQLQWLKEGWQDEFLALNAKSPTYKATGVLLRFCGLRPVELEKGVIVTAEDGVITVEIQGGKVREGYAGQPWRRFALKKEILPAWFVKDVEREGSIAVSADPEGLRSHLARLSEKLFPRRRKAGKRDVILSAYLFRHSLVTELREDGWDSVDIAGLIGESTADTVRWYGLRVRTGSVKPEKVAIVSESLKTAVPVRPVDLSSLEGQIRKPETRKKQSSVR
jgi:integrase